MEFKDGKFVGADEYIKTVREQYPDEFDSDDPGETEKHVFVRGTSHTYKPGIKSQYEAYMEQKYGNNKYYKK